MSFAFSEESEAGFQALLKRYPKEQRMAALIPTLYLVQDQEGHLSLDSMRYVAERLEVPPSQVLNTATFYTLLRKEPVGRFHLQVCTNVSCYLRGSDELLDVIRDKCGISPGEVSDDRVFSCEEVQCLAACECAPAMQVNWDYHEGLTPESLAELVDKLRASAKGGGEAPAEQEA
jgi:NADH-quinone oxidoreductase E subunit